MSDRIDGVDALGEKLNAAFTEIERGEAVKKRRSRAWRISGGAVALATSLLLAVALVGRGGGGGGPEQILTVQQAVAAVAKAAFDQPALPENNYLHMLTRTQNLAGGRGRTDGGKGKQLTVHTIQTFDQETWTRLGKPEIRRYTSLPAQFVTPRDRANELALNALPYKNVTRSCVSQAHDPATASDSALASDGDPAALGASEVPTNARAAYRAMLKKARAQSGPGVDVYERVWSEVQQGMMAGASPLTAEQRAALVGALAYVPGVKVLPARTDPNGNTAVGFQRISRGQRDVVFFDTRTSLTTYVRGTLVKPVESMGSTLPAGSLIWGYELKKYEFVDAPPKFSKLHHAGKGAPNVCM